MIPVNDLKRGFELFRNEYEAKALDVLRSGWYILGNEVNEFEKEFAKALRMDCYAAGVDNGLNAIHLGLIAAGIEAEDEVIVQANGYIATILGVIQCGAIPVFVEPDLTFNMNADLIEDAITDKTKAVLITHLYGQASNMRKIQNVCEKNALLLFEDCAQSHFASFDDQYTGTFGTAGFYSFYPTKNLGGFGDGGAVVSKNKNIIDRVKVLRNYGSDYRYHNIQLGYNARLDEIQAGLLRVKLRHYKELINNRRKYANKYLKEIKNRKIKLPVISNDSTHVWYQFVIMVEERKKFIDYMFQNEIKVDINWETPPYLQPAMLKYGYHRGDFPITEKICDCIVSLPMMDDMSDSELEQIISAVNLYG